ncbi:MAG: hypothetical protein V4689_01330 [Verrucomicrobiota bacterium]
MKVELFELFDDPFVQEEFGRRRKVDVPLLERHTWLPSPEDVVVKGTDFLDMAYIANWCAIHGTTERLEKALAEIPPM